MRKLVALAALSAGVAVCAGAFGAHGAAGRPAEWLRTGAEYQMVHAVGVLAIAGRPRAGLPGGLLLGGAAVFAGTLYLMALGLPRWLGAVTPLGGLAMIAGWIVLAVGALRGESQETAP